MAGVTGNLFLEVGLVVIIAAFAAYTLRLFKQPQILAYVLVGVLLTPVLGIVTDTGVVESMSAIGIAFLLFIVGMEMDLSSLKNVALVSTLGGVFQVVLVFVTGYVTALFLGFLSLEAAYIGLFIAFSSTMVVMKLISDKRELHTLHGRLAIGILLTQDIIAILALSVLTTTDGFSASIFGIALLKFALIFGIAFFASKFIFPTMFKFAAKNQELLLICSLAVCFIFSILALKIGIVIVYILKSIFWRAELSPALLESVKSGFSIAIGAFVAGIALGNLDYSHDIIGKIKSLKDFFSLLFFVSLGMAISVSVIKEMWLEITILLLVVMLIKPFIIMLICTLFRYTKRPSFLTANSLAQIGEFSLILAAQGLLLGHISQELFSLTIVITLASITLTSYYIEYNEFFYKLLKKPLSLFDKFNTEGLEYLPQKTSASVILCGHNRIGYSILSDLRHIRKKVLVVDYNPEIISMMVEKGYHCLYGDATDEEIIEKMNLNKVSLFISTIPETDDNILLLRKIRAVNKRAKVIIAANDIEEALHLYKQGASYVILPHFLGGEHVSSLITDVRRKKIDLRVHREDHIEHLEERKDAGHKHPKHH